MAIRRIQNKGAGKYLSVGGTNVTSLNAHQNVTVRQLSNTNEQIWEIGVFSFPFPIKSVIDTTYGLNVLRSGQPYNCDVYTISGNQTDSDIVMSLPAPVYFKVKLRNYDLYLTAASAADGANVYWAAESDSDFQKWGIALFDDDGVVKFLDMPENVNQKYSGYKSLNTDIEDLGCAVCCACDLASYYGETDYSLEDLMEKGVFTSSSVACVWSKVPEVSFSADIKSNFLSTIKSEIDEGRPVLVQLGNTGDATYSHWVVAFGYSNSAQSNKDILVLDPAGISDKIPGEIRSLTAAMSHSYMNKISLLKKTSKKN